MEMKVLGKISHVSFGEGGYQEAMFGLSLQFRMGCSGVGTFDGWWGGKRNEHAKWTEEDRIKFLGEMVLRISALMKEAGVKSVEQLVGIPVEVTLENGTFKSFRILTEVL